MAEKIQDKNSISPLGDMLLHQQRKRKADLSGLYVRHWLKSDYFPPSIVKQNLIFSLHQTNIQSDFPLILTYSEKHKLEGEKKKRRIDWRVWFHSASEQVKP